MKKSPVLLLAAVALSTALPAIAGCENSTCSGKINSFAQSLKVTSDGLFITLLKDIDRKALACELVQSDFVRVPEQSPHFDSMHALLLTAFSGNADVVIEFDSSKTKCVLDSIELLPAS